MSQTSYSDNWAGPETGSVTWVSNINGVAEKQILAKVFNKNSLKLAFGRTHLQFRETKSWARPDISTDLIDLESTFRITLESFVEPIGAFRILSQFVSKGTAGDNKYFNPVTLTESAGIARVFFKEENRELTSRFGAALRQHINQWNNPRSEYDGGLELVTDLKTPVGKERIDITSKLTIFQALVYSEAEKVKNLPGGDYWKAPDLNLENIFTAGITKYLMVNLYAQLLYDKQISRGGRFKQTLSLGPTFKFI